MRTAFSDPALLSGTIARRVRPGHLGVVTHAPAAAETPLLRSASSAYAACGCVERPDRIPHCPSSSHGLRCPARSGLLSRLRQQARELGRRADHGPVTGIDVDKRDVLALRHLGTWPWSIHCRAWAGLNSGQISTTGTA